MSLDRYKKSVIETLIVDYVDRLDAEREERLEEDYEDIVYAFTDAFSDVLEKNVDSLFEVLNMIRNDPSLAKKLSNDAYFIEAFDELLEYPSQDDFYGTEGWEHFLGLD